MNRGIRIIVILGIVVLGIIFIIHPRYFAKEEVKIETEKSSPTASSKLNIKGNIIDYKILNDDLRITGSLTANERVILRSEVSGRVVKINFQEGRYVNEGQVLIQLDDSEIRAEIEKLNFTKKLNEDNEFRQKQLLEREAISKEEYETALTTLNTTLSEIKLKEIQLRKHRIVAPFSGIAGLRNISTGSYVSPSEDLVTVYNINPIKLEFSVPGKYAPLVSVGDSLVFQVNAYDDMTFNGSIYAIEPQIDLATRSINIRALCYNNEGKLLPGQFAKIILTVASYEKAIMIPTEAVVPELNSKKIFILENGKVATRTIETGIRKAEYIQVINGLNKGDTVLTTGILQLSVGADINLILPKE